MNSVLSLTYSLVSDRKEIVFEGLDGDKIIKGGGGDSRSFSHSVSLYLFLSPSWGESRQRSHNI